MKLSLDHELLICNLWRTGVVRMGVIDTDSTAKYIPSFSEQPPPCRQEVQKIKNIVKNAAPTAAIALWDDELDGMRVSRGVL